MDVCLRVLKESNKSRFDSCSVRNSVLNISHITFRDCRVHIFGTTVLEVAVYKRNLDKLVRSFCSSFGDQEMLGDESRWQKYFT